MKKEEIVQHRGGVYKIIEVDWDSLANKFEYQPVNSYAGRRLITWDSEDELY